MSRHFKLYLVCLLNTFKWDIMYMDTHEKHICMHTHIHTHAPAHIHTRAGTHSYTYINMLVRANLRTHTYTRAHATRMCMNTTKIVKQYFPTGLLYAICSTHRIFLIYRQCYSIQYVLPNTYYAAIYIMYYIFLVTKLYEIKN